MMIAQLLHLSARLAIVVEDVSPSIISINEGVVAGILQRDKDSLVRLVLGVSFDRDRDCLDRLKSPIKAAVSVFNPRDEMLGAAKVPEPVPKQISAYPK